MARDRYKYFRIEGRELVEGLMKGCLALEKGPFSEATLDQLLRQAHTLKGSARVVGQAAIADSAHALEGILQPYRQAPAPLSPAHLARALALLDEIEAGIAELGAPEGSAAEGAVTAAEPAAAAEETIETVRIELSSLDALVSGITEAGVQLDELKRQGARLERALAEAAELADALADGPHGRRALALAEALEEVQRALAHAQSRAESEVDLALEQASRLRLVPASLVFTQLERAARDAGAALGKPIAFEATSQAARLDAHVLLGVRDALLHVIRNAVDHGIEPEAERRALGKPAAGQLRLSVERHGARVVFACSDDGRGIDAAALRQAAVRQGLASVEEAAALDPDQTLALIFQPGLSTRRTATQLSGRGVGLDAVRAIATGLKGQVRAWSEAGKGTRFELAVPVSLSVSAALLLSADGLTAALPLENVEKVLRVSPGAVTCTPEGETLLVSDRALPFLPLAEAFGLRRGAQREHAWSVAVVRAGTGRAALGAEHLLGVAELVVRPLPEVVGSLPLVSGAGFDAEGAPRPVLDPLGVVAKARSRGAAPAPAARARELPVLVIDDSLTTRMLEQSILESAGYEVELAASAEEGLAKARARRYGLFIVDVEMPGMDGFEFVALTRADPAFAMVPAILVTSRSAPADRRRGLEAGARAYILKGDFEQRAFLDIVGELVGRSA